MKKFAIMFVLALFLVSSVFATPSIIKKEQNCTDGIDDDSDTWIDCADPDCKSDAACKDDNPGVGSIDDECKDFGFDYGVAKWQCDDKEMFLTGVLLNFWSIDEEAYPGTSVIGTCNEADWNVGTSGATGIVVKAGNTVHYPIRDTSGTIYQAQPALSHLTFCGDEPDGDVPEFGVIGALAILGVAGIFIAKKRN